MGIAIFVNEANDHYTRGYNFPIGTTPKKCPLARKRKIFWGWFRWESCSPGYSGHLFHQQKSRSLNKKLTSWSQISKFWGQKSTFSSLAANWSLTDQCFQHEKGVSLESRYEGTKIFTTCPKIIGFWAQKRPNLAKNWRFRPNIGIFG